MPTVQEVCQKHAMSRVGDKGLLPVLTQPQSGVPGSSNTELADGEFTGPQHCTLFWRLWRWGGVVAGLGGGGVVDRQLP